MSRLEDAKIAVENYGWKWVHISGKRRILLPPENDNRKNWAGIWDENGIPHYLPRYSKGEK